MTEQEQAQAVDNMINLMLGDRMVSDGKGGQVKAPSRLVADISEQLNAELSPQITEMAGDIAALKEGMEKMPPSARQKKGIGPAPWDPMAHAMGIPDPNWYNPDAPGVALDGKFDDFRDFCLAVVNRYMNGVQDDRLTTRIRTKSAMAAEQMTGEELQLGGALVPEEFRPRLMMMGLQQTSIRRMATVIPMGAPRLTLPTIRDSSHADGMTFGGVKFQWLEVNTTIPRSRPDFNTVSLDARTLSGRIELPNTLLQDSFTSVPTLIATLWQQAVPWIEESVFIRGDGSGKPEGILNAEAAIDVKRDTASEFKVSDIYEMESRLPPGAATRAVWVANRQLMPQFGMLNNAEVQSWHPSLDMSMPDRLNGRPIIWNEHASGLGARGDIMLVDWMYYLIGDLQTLTMASSAHEEFSDHVTVIKGVERIDGRPWVETALVPAQRTGTDYTMSPFVILDSNAR